MAEDGGFGEDAAQEGIVREEAWGGRARGNCLGEDRLDLID
jgi:hypothetical protein